MSDKKAYLCFDGCDDKIELEMHSGTVGPDTIDITPLYNKAKVFTYDPGFLSTASCNSSITYIDGAEGILRYRGYPIEQLAEHSSFLEVAHLLMYGQLPAKADLNGFKDILTHHTMLNDALLQLMAHHSRRIVAQHEAAVLLLKQHRIGRLVAGHVFERPAPMTHQPSEVSRGIVAVVTGVPEVEDFWNCREHVDGVRQRLSAGSDPFHL